MADTYSWIGSSGGSWGSGSNWADVTTTTSPAGTVPGGLNAAIVNGATGSAYEVITGGGSAASVTMTGLVDLSGSYAVSGSLAVGNNTDTGWLDLGMGAALTAGAIAINNGTVSVTGTGAALTTASSLTIGMEPSGTVVNDGVLTIGAGASLAATGSVLIAAGMLKLSGLGASATLGSLTVGLDTIFNGYNPGGNVAIADGATLTAGNITEVYGGSGLGTVTYNGISVTGVGSRLLSTGTVTLLNSPSSGSLNVTGGASFQTARLVFQPSGNNLSTASFSMDSLSAAEIGTLGSANAGTLSVDAGATILAGGNASITAPTILDNGVIAVTGGTLTLAGANTYPATGGTIEGTGTLLIGANSLLQLDGTVASTDTVSFAGTAAALEIGWGSSYDSSTFTYTYGLNPENAAIAGFAIGDSIAFDNTILTAATYVATGTGVGTLELMNGITQVASLTLDGTYTGDSFFISPTVNGGTAVSILAPGGSGISPVSTTTDTYSWIGSSGGSWGGGSNWADVTTSISPAGTVPGGLNAAIVNGGTGSAYEVITGGGAAASLLLTGLVDLSGTYAVTGLLTAGNNADTGSLYLATGAALTAGAIAINNGTVSVTGAALTTAGSLTIGTESSTDSANGVLTIGAGASLAATGSVLVAAGTLWLSGSGASAHLGSLTVGVTSTSSNLNFGGVVAIDSGATLTAGNITEAYGGYSFGAVPYNGISVTGVGSRLLSTGTVTLLNSPSSDTLDVTSGASFQAAGLVFQQFSSSTAISSFSLDSLSKAEIGTLGNATAGTLSVDAGSTILAGGNASITAPTILDNGVIAVTGGTLTLAGANTYPPTSGTIEGTGTLLIGANSLLQLDGSVASTDTVGFAGTAAALEIGQGSTYDSFTGTLTYTGLYPENAAIAGFAIGDSITFDNTVLTAATYVATGIGVGTLELMNGITQVASLTLDGTYTGTDFFISPTTNGGATVSILAPGGSGISPVSTTTDTYSWIGSSGGSWGSGSNWADVTTSTSPAGTVPGGLNAAIVNGGTGSAYEVITGGGTAASLLLTGLVDLSGSYDVGGVLTLGTTATDSLDLGTGATLAAGAIAINNGTVTVTGTGAALTSAGSLTIGTASGALGTNGLLTIGAGASLAATGSVLVAGTLWLNGSAASAHLGSLTVGIAQTSSIYDPGGVVGIDNGATLTAGNITEAYGGVGSGSTYYSGITVTGVGSRLLTTGAVTLLNSYNTSTLDVTGGASFQTAGLVFQQSGSSTAIASFSLDSLSAAEIGTLGSAAAGTLSVDAGMTILAGSNASVTAPIILDNGIIAVTGGTLTLAGTIEGTGTLRIGANSLLQLDGKVASTDTVSFAGTAAALEIGQGSTFSSSTFTFVNTGLFPENAAITGFAIGDSITFDNTVLTAATYVATGTGVGTLELMNGITQVASLTLDGTYTGDSFFISPTVNGGTAVSILAPGALCFLPGTLIRTPAGQTEVERLSAGDMVLTASGQTRPIVWVGTGRVLATRGRRNAATPVIVRKGALAPNVPHADLRVTKGHSFFIDDVLIPVEFLVNHRSVLWDDRAQEVTVYHIELETHDVLLANGAAAESYRDAGNRWLFQNANAGWDQPQKPHYAPVLTGGPIVDAVWRRLLDRAGGRPGLPLTDDPELHLMVDGLRVDAAVRTDDVLVFDIGRPAGQVRIVSRAAAPQELGVARDPRCLGVALRGIAVRCGTRFRTIQIDDPLLTDGFHACEPGLRWTDGDAILPMAVFDRFADGCEVVLHIGGRTLYVEDGRIAAIA